MKSRLRPGIGNLRNQPLLDQNFKRILLLNFGGIGDEILFFPVIQALRQHYQEARISMVVEPRCQNIIEHNYAIDEIFTFDIKTRKHPGDLLDMLSLLRHEAPDIIISSGSSPMVALLLFLSGVPYRVGYASHNLAFLLTHAAPLNKDQYAAKMYYDLLLPLGFPEKTPIPEIHLPEIVDEWAHMWLRSQNIRDDEPFILIHPGVSQLSKEKQLIKSWHVNKWEALIHKLLADDWRVILAGGPDDREDVEYLLEHIEHKKFTSAYGQTHNIYQLGGLIQRANLMVCVDSAPMHLGVALGASMVVLFGPTNEKKLLPPDVPHIQPVTFPVDCRPCLWETRNTTCAALSCLVELDVAKVYEMIRNQLQKPQEVSV